MKPIELRKLKKQASNGTVQQGLSSIYRNRDGSLPDISHLEIQRKSRAKALLLTVVIFGVLIATAGWMIFVLLNPNYQFGDKSLEITVDSPQNVASGDEVSYAITYRNREKVTLGNAELIFRYPDGFTFIEGQPAASNEFNTTWQLGDLDRGAAGTITIRGKIIGEVGSLKTLNITSSFEPENFSSVFKETETFSSQITSTILALTVTGPEKILPEKKATYSLKYKNASQQDLTGVIIEVIYPQDFIFQEAQPAAYHNQTDARNLNNQWRIENLNRNQEGEILISGGFPPGEQTRTAELKATIGFLDSNTNVVSVQQEQLVSTQIINSGLKLDLIINGANQDQPVNFGQRLTYSLSYKNIGQHELSNVSLSLDINSQIVDFDSLNDSLEGTLNGQVITWGPAQSKKLELLKPLNEGTIDFSIQIKSPENISLSVSSLATQSTLSATVGKIDDIETPDLVIAGGDITNSINTDIALKVEGRYFDEDNIAVGTGPLPPVVGEKTTFRIYWSVANSLHDVSDVTVTAKLPDGVSFDNKFLVRTGVLTYSQQTNTVEWLIDLISANKTLDDISAWFDVAVTPTKQQVRRLLILTDQATLTATDEVTQSAITKTAKAVTSNLEDDPIGGGRGLVIDITE